MIFPIVRLPARVITIILLFSLIDAESDISGGSVAVIRGSGEVEYKISAGDANGENRFDFRADERKGKNEVMAPSKENKIEYRSNVFSTVQARELHKSQAIINNRYKESSEKVKYQERSEKTNNVKPEETILLLDLKNNALSGYNSIKVSTVVSKGFKNTQNTAQKEHSSSNMNDGIENNFKRSGDLNFRHDDSEEKVGDHSIERIEESIIILKQLKDTHNPTQRVKADSPYSEIKIEGVVINPKVKNNFDVETFRSKAQNKNSVVAADSKNLTQRYKIDSPYNEIKVGDVDMKPKIKNIFNIETVRSKGQNENSAAAADSKNPNQIDKVDSPCSEIKIDEVDIKPMIKKKIYNVETVRSKVQNGNSAEAADSKNRTHIDKLDSSTSEIKIDDVDIKPMIKNIFNVEAVRSKGQNEHSIAAADSNANSRFDFKKRDDFTASEHTAAASGEGKQSNVVTARSAVGILPRHNSEGEDAVRRVVDRKESPPPNENKTGEIVANGNFADHNGEHWHDRPSKLVSDGCQESIMAVDEPNDALPKTERDMEFTDKDRIPRGKSANLKDSITLDASRSISHSNRYDKERRAIADHLFAITSTTSAHKSPATAGSFGGGRREEFRKRPSAAERPEINAKYPEGNSSLADEEEESNSGWRARDKDKNKGSVVRFGAPPPRDRYLLDSMRLTEGPFVFGFISGIFSVIHPFDFPTELLRDVIWDKLSVTQLLFHSLRIEIGFIIAIIIAISAALITPMYALCHAILNKMPKAEERAEPGSLLDCDRIRSGKTKQKTLILFIQSLLILTLASTIGMIYSNEDLSKTSQITRQTIEAIVHDIDTYASTAALELKHALAAGADDTMQAIDNDLNRVRLLLGEPIQKTLASETGIDVTFEAIRDIVTATEEVVRKVHVVLEMTAKSSELASSARDRLRDLQRQIDNVKRLCALRDQPLCETIDSNGVELVIKFDLLLAERRLPSQETLGNLTAVAAAARKSLNAVPISVDDQTKPVREGIRRTLEEKREKIHMSVRVFDLLSRHLSATTRTLQARFDSWVRNYESFDYWRWVIMLCATILVLFISLVMMASVSCGCCKLVNYAIPFMKTSMALICIYCLVLWSFTIAVFVIGGHGEVFICRPLYDEPEYRVMGKLLDKPGLLFPDHTSFFHSLFQDLPNITIEVPIKDALRECRLNRPSYPTFRLNRVLDVGKETQYFHWEPLKTDLKRIIIEINKMSIGTLELQKTLQRALASTNANFTHYRALLNGPLTGKDLASLSDQLESIGNQMTDLSASSRMETIASRTRRLIQTVLHPLDQQRTELVYKLTELELQIQPYHRQINLAVSHLKTIEYYIEKQGVVIADKKTADYVMRILSYLEQYRGHVVDTIENFAAPCGVLWTIFNATRSLVCQHFNDSLNGFWCSSLLCAILWVAITPLVLELVDSLKDSQKSRRQIFPRTLERQNTIESAFIDRDGAWSSPGPPPPQPDNW